MFTENAIQKIMSKPNEYVVQINFRAKKTLKDDFETHAKNKGFTKTALLKALVKKDIEENIIKPK